MTSICEVCSQPSTQCCARCKLVYFCSNQHYRHYWNNTKHSKTCKRVGEAIRILARVGLHHSPIWGVDVIVKTACEMREALIDHSRITNIMFPTVTNVHNHIKEEDMIIDETDSMKVALLCSDMLSGDMTPSIKTHLKNYNNKRFQTMDELKESFQRNSSDLQSGHTYIITLSNGDKSHTMLVVQSPVLGHKNVSYQLLSSFTGKYTLLDYVQKNTQAKYADPMEYSTLQSTVLKDIQIILDQDLTCIEAFVRLSGVHYIISNPKLTFTEMSFRMEDSYNRLI